MKKYLFFLLITGFISPVLLYSQKKCAAYDMVRQQMAVDPAYSKKISESEKGFTNYKRQTGLQQRGGKPSAITIPVVVHVIYNTPEQNISDAQVQSQIDVLNEDFTATNSDYNNYDAGYRAVKGDAGIEFCLVQVIHKETSHKSFPANDGMKFTKKGGSDAVDPMHILNIWVCNLRQNLLGYAYYPGIKPEIFGVVCHYRAFGRGASYNLFADYNLGRTMTHEVGHSFGLAHIWGDRTCGNDFVDDTPLHNNANFGCPGEGHLSTCTGTPLEMWMNYMDYTDDRCMYFLSDGQVSRADYFIDNDPQLNSIVNSSCSNSRTDGNNYITGVSKNGITSYRQEQNSFQIYPTITSGKLTLDIKSVIAGNAVINIYNQTGALVMKQKIFVAEGGDISSINVNNLANGGYILQLIQGTDKKVKKFIVQH